MQREIITTEDGSSTLYVPELNEHYHSIHGAIQESRHVFIDAGYKLFSHSTDTINVLEVGLGTGLNALLTYEEATRNYRKVNYVGIEPFPLSPIELKQLNYAELIDFEDSAKVFMQMHTAAWDIVPRYISDSFILHKLKKGLAEAGFKPESFQLVYFDAFGPDVQPELWEKHHFVKLYDALAPGGVLVTYSAKGSVKRALKEAGFEVENLPGPPGKREMTRAKK